MQTAWFLTAPPTDEQTYGGIDRATNRWWESPSREYTEEELEILRRKMREAMDEIMKIPAQ